MVNISWGTKIAILYSTFVAMIIVMVYISMNQKIELVSDDYYEKELAFQEKIDQTNNANALSESVTHTISENGIELKFPTVFTDKKINGEILFYRPSDKSKDISIPVTVNSDLKQFVSSQQLSSGMYKMRLSWEVDNVKYFTEKVIVMP